MFLFGRLTEDSWDKPLRDCSKEVREEPECIGDFSGEKQKQTNIQQKITCS